MSDHTKESADALSGGLCFLAALYAGQTLRYAILPIGKDDPPAPLQYVLPRHSIVIYGVLWGVGAVCLALAAIRRRWNPFWALGAGLAPFAWGVCYVVAAFVAHTYLTSAQAAWGGWIFLMLAGASASCVVARPRDGWRGWAPPRDVPGVFR